MSESDQPGRGGNVIAGLLAPLRLPERVLDALDTIVEAVQSLGPMSAEIVQVRKQTAPVADLLPALDDLEASLGDRLNALSAELTRVREQTEPMAELLPALDDLEKSIDSRLDAMSSELVRVREQTEPMAELLPALDGLEKSIDSRLDAMGSELVRVREQTASMAEVLPALDRLQEAIVPRLDRLLEVVGDLESNESHLNKRIDDLLRELSAMHETMGALQGDIQRITDRLPDPGEKRGPLETARDVLTSRGD